MLSRDRNGTHPSNVPSANLNGDTVGTVTFAAFDQNNKVEISSFHCKSLIDSNQDTSGDVLFQVTNPKESSRFRFNDHENMELGDDNDEFYISRPNQTIGSGQFLSITGQQAEHGNGGSLNIYPGNNPSNKAGGGVSIAVSKQKESLDVYEKVFDPNRTATVTITATSVVLRQSMIFDVSRGNLVLSPSQKASIFEGVGKDINIGAFDIRADDNLKKMLSAKFVSTARLTDGL